MLIRSRSVPKRQGSHPCRELDTQYLALIWHCYGVSLSVYRQGTHAISRLPMSSKAFHVTLVEPSSNLAGAHVMKTVSYSFCPTLGLRAAAGGVIGKHKLLCTP